MSPRLLEAAWPLERLGDAAIALAGSLGLSPAQQHLGEPPAGADPRALTRWLETLERPLQLEFHPIEPSLSVLGAAITQGLPRLALLQTGGAGGGPGHSAAPPRAASRGDRVLIIVRATRRRVVLLGPDGRRIEVDRGEVEDALSRAILEGAGEHIEPFLDLAAVPHRRRPAARRALLADWLEERQVAQLWQVRISAAAPLRRQASRAHLPRLAVLITLAFAAAQLLVLLSWWMIGAGAFSGHLEAGWLSAWTLVLLSSAPFLQASGWLQGRFSIAAARILKSRLLRGSLSVDPDVLKREGIGHQIGRVIEAETFEQLSLNGAFLGVLALFQLAGAAAALAIGPGDAYQVAALAGWGAVTGVSGWRFHRARVRWSDLTLRLTHDAVERMVGNRTRLVQRPEALWHEDEDRDLASVTQAAAVMDRRHVALRAVVPRGWLAVGLASLLPAAIEGQLPTARLAVGLGGVLLAYQGFYLLSQSLVQILNARVSWTLIRDLFHAGAAEPAAVPVGASGTEEPGSLPVMDASSLSFRYPGRAMPVLAQCSLTIAPGDRILLQGPSGGGKSTLASLLAGLREAQEGTLLLEGLDRHTLGKEEWRRRVVLVPQFHDNHVFTASFAFNLLVGRRWPAHDEDYRAAEAVCHGLGLGKLLDRMPGGLAEMVGEAGWRLSHGERSRMFVARAILQSPRLLILDESFGALDPRNVLRCLDYVRQQPSSLVLIAHP